MFENGDTVTVTADWLGMRRKTKGEVLACLLRLNRAQSLRSSPLFPPISLPPIYPSYSSSGRMEL
jgi:hypothetical protein